MNWNNLTTHQKEVMAIKYGVSCTGSMELLSEKELEKIPASAWPVETLGKAEVEIKEEKVNELKCTVCGKEYKQLTRLNKHLETHK